MVTETDLRHSQNGVTIIFTEIPKINNLSMYSFAVEGDDDITQKLCKSVKHKEVLFKRIQTCAKALFVIIEEGKFIELATIEEAKVLFRKFEELFERNPIFVVKDLFSPNRPWFSSAIINANQPAKDYGEGRTKLQAKFEALKKLLNN